MEVGDQFFGADVGAQAAGVTLIVIDDGQVIDHFNGVGGADFFALEAADTSLVTATKHDGALRVGGAGDGDVCVVFGCGDDAP